MIDTDSSNYEEAHSKDYMIRYIISFACVYLKAFVSSGMCWVERQCFPGGMERVAY